MLDDDVWRYLPLGPVPSLVVGVIGLALAVGVARSRSRAARGAAAALLLVSVLAVLAVTARGTPADADGEFSWRLGASIRGELGSVNQALGLVNVVGNVLLFLPIGWLAAVLAGRRPVAVGLVSAVVLSVVVEVGQVAAGSFGDVDDLVLNSLGGLLGAVVATALGSLGERRYDDRLGVGSRAVDG